MFAGKGEEAALPLWAVHGDGRRVPDDATIAAGERLGWPLTVGFGAQQLVAVAGATVLVPALTGLSPATSLLFSGLGTLAFLLFTRHRLPAYLGSAVAIVLPLQAARGSGLAAQLGGVLLVGLVLAAVGIAVKAMGNRVIDALMPPPVAGAVVLLVGLSLAPSAAEQFGSQPWLALLTLLLVLAAFLAPGVGGRLAVLAGIAAGWLVAALAGAVDPQRYAEVGRSAWFGLPPLTTPQITPSVVLGMLPVVIVLVVETVGAVRAIGAITGRRVEGLTGDALLANGVASALAGLGGGAATALYPQAIGTMAASRVCSTASYAVAALGAVALSLSPKAAAVLLTMPAGVLGAVSLVLYGLIAVRGAKIWLDERVDLRDPTTAVLAGAALVAGAGGLSVHIGDVRLGGAVWGTAGIMLLYPLLRRLRGLRRPVLGVRPPSVPPPVSQSVVPPSAIPPSPLRGGPGGVGWQLGQK
jgi:uracil-xanthine permease